MDKAILTPNDGNQVSWSKEVRKEDGSSVRTNVEKINNGFLIIINTEGKDAKGEWKYDTKKEFSETNPFEEEEEEKEEMSLAEKLEKFMKG